MRVVTWNIQFGKGRDGRVDLARIVETARALGDFDVLCLQEVAANYPSLDHGPGEDQPARLAEKLPGHALVFRPAIETWSPVARCFGNLVFSRLPVLQVLSHVLPRPPEAGTKSMQRQALEVVVAASFGPVRVVTTHLEFYSERHRAAQIDRLIELHRETALRAALGERRGPEEGPYETLPRPPSAILCGDFNFEPDWPDYAAATAPLEPGVPPLLDAWRVAHPGTPHPPTCGIDDLQQWKGGPNTRDFFFVTADLGPRIREVRVDTATAASDHQPVLLELA